jgi:uncharacterized protein with von Willebrand factor type A (vWA) domain
VRAQAQTAALHAPERLLLGFARALRAAGIALTAEHTLSFLDAVSRLGIGHRRGVYWAGRATLCGSPQDLPVYDYVFELWFNSAQKATQPRHPAQRPMSQADPGDGGTDDDGAAESVVESSIRASREEVLRHRDIASLDPEERIRLNRLFAALTVTLPQRRRLRRRRSRRGAVDVSRTLRDQLRRGGEPGPLRFRRHRTAPRQIVLLIDVSGSMTSYAESLLRLAHRIVAQAPRHVEVFTLGTRLTRVTAALAHGDVDQALRLAGAAVPDWSGGTRLGEVLGAFLVRWPAAARGAIVVIASDGWERGDAALLGERLGQLRRVSRRIIWSNPHRGKTGYRPVQSGIVAALPHIDGLLSGHSLQSFEELLEVLSDA